MKSLTQLIRIGCCLLLAGLFFTCGGAKEAVAPIGNGTGGSMARFTVVGAYLYTVDHQNLKVFSLADPSNPVFLRTVPIGFDIETIFPFRDRLFIGSKSAVYFFSIANPELPVKVSEAIEPSIIRRCDPVVAKDSVAFATLNVSGPCGGSQSVLVVYDIRNLEQPIKVEEQQLSQPYGLGYSDTTLYVCDYRYGLRIYNIRNAWSPTLKKTLLNGTYFDVFAYGNQLICWVETGMVIYDISKPEDPVLKAEVY
jgi:hypothetical protein